MRNSNENGINFTFPSLDFARTLLLIFHILSAFQQIAVDMQSWRRLIEVILMNEF
jgi:hypothetical protein